MVFRAIIIASSVVGGPVALPTTVHAAAPADGSAEEMFYPTAVVVEDPDVDKSSHHRLTVDTVRYQTEQMLKQEHRIRVASQPADAKATLTIHLKTEDEEGFLYYVDIEVETPEGRRTLPQSTCERISTVDLVNCVRARMPEISRALVNPPDPDEITQVPRPSKGPEQPKPTEPPAPSRRLGSKGIAGVVLLPIGALTVVGGGIVYATTPSSKSTGAQVETTNRRPLTISLISAGSAVALTGIALLITDRVQAKSKRRPSISPSLAPGSAGVLILGRF